MIAVTGASGFVGRALLRRLAAGEEPVRALVRSDDAAREVTALGAEVVRGDVRDRAAVDALLAGCRLVYHLAGAYKGAEAELVETHVAGAANVARALEPDARVVFLSSTSVYGWTGPWPADEVTPTRPVTAYGRAKVEAERRLREAGAVIVRSTIVYGPGDEHGMIPRAARMLRRGLRWFPGDGRNRIHLVHVDDLVHGMLLAAERGDGVYVMPGPRALPVRTILAALAEGLGVRPPAFGVPASAVRGAAAGVRLAWRATGSDAEPPLTEHSLDVLVRDRAFSGDRARGELGWVPSTDTEAGLRAYAEELRAGRPASPGPEWRSYLVDPDEGLGTTYERFALAGVLDRATALTGSRSVLHAPLFGMTGIPGLETILLARSGVRAGLLDVDADRLQAIEQLWKELGQAPETHLAPWPADASWAGAVPRGSYDLVFSFAALWWFDDPWTVLAAQARWAARGVLVCVPNAGPMLKVRARTWHRAMFEHLNLEALDPRAIEGAARAQGLELVDEGVFDLPPFPDTAVPLAKVLRRGRPAGADAPGRWRWSILPWLRGEDPTLEDRMVRVGVVERRAPRAVRERLAHHRYLLFARRGSPR